MNQTDVTGLTKSKEQLNPNYVQTKLQTTQKGFHTNAGYLHDGRARNIEEAILWHEGEAKNAKETYLNLSTSDRTAMIQFLQSL